MLKITKVFLRMLCKVIEGKGHKYVKTCYWIANPRQFPHHIVLLDINTQQRRYIKKWRCLFFVLLSLNKQLYGEKSLMI